MRGWTRALRGIGVALAVAALAIGAGTVDASEVSGQQMGHISNGSGNVESDIRPLDFQGTLKSRFRADPIAPGTREVIAAAVAICDGGTLSSTRAKILVPVAGAAPEISGGLGAIPCVPSAGTDGLATGVNGGVVTFSGSLAEYMGTTRVYADSDQDGTFFEPGELVTQGVPNFNSGTNQAIVAFGRQGQILSDSSGRLVADTTDSLPLILIVTVDVDNNAPSGTVDVAFGVGVGDDTAQGGGGICATRIGTNCGSNLMQGGPARDRFQVQASGGGPTPPGGGGSGSVADELKSYDTNPSNGLIDDPEFLQVVNDWIDAEISDNVFFTAMDLWVKQKPISSAAVGAEPRVQTRRTSRGLRFVAPRAQAMTVSVYGLDGRRVFRRTTHGDTLSWNLQTKNGAPVANGVYLYRATVTPVEGSTVSAPIRKVIVQR